jgi:hypothetical protein
MERLPLIGMIFAIVPHMEVLTNTNITIDMNFEKYYIVSAKSSKRSISLLVRNRS